jgi:hypothetical protein
MKVELEVNRGNHKTQMDFAWQDDEGFFFGHIYLTYDEASGKTEIDSETMGPEFVKKVIGVWVDETMRKQNA